MQVRNSRSSSGSTVVQTDGRHLVNKYALKMCFSAMRHNVSVPLSGTVTVSDTDTDLVFVLVFYSSLLLIDTITYFHNCYSY